MISTKCTECSTVGEGAMICFSPSVCLPISRDSATLSSPPFFAQTKRNGGDQKKLQHFKLTKVSTGSNIPPSYICYSPTGLSLPLPLIYRRAQLRKFIHAHSHITQACALTADFSEGLDLTKVKLTNLKMYSPASVQSHRCYPRLPRG